MKKLFKSMFVLAAISSSLLFTSCGDKTDDPTTTESAAPTLTVNDGVKTSSASLSVDSIEIKVLASADTDRKIKKLTITRAITGGSTNTIKDATYDAKDVIYTHQDIIAGAIVIDEGSIITYSVTVTDDKGKTANTTYVVTISSMATSGQILIGGPANTTNEYRFLGTSDGFRTYRAGSVGSDLAKDNSAKIDFLYFYNSAGSVQNAIYSPDYGFTSGSGWFTEVSAWPSKNKTMLKLTPDITSSDFDALQGSTFLDEISIVDFTTGTQDRIANLGIGQVFAFKKADGKRGFVLVGNIATSDAGQILLKVKTEL
ncbi:MAG: hypothetical protein K9H61_07700 [Bacteroidia bacterium]|nr:hypothetical protein [Bacteroidia bacterium]MCF8446865.1 hypothetical protein [Bacteroidia bacterium]